MRKIIIASVLIALGGCATLLPGGTTPAAVLDAIDNAINMACGAVPTINSIQQILASDGIANPTAEQITMVAQQVCSVISPPAKMTMRAAGSPTAPVILGYLNGKPIYGYWVK